MAEKELSTLQVILITGKNEFAEKGYSGASLRNIAREAGVTTGAFYGYFKSKSELFDALVGNAYNEFFEKYCRAQKEFADQPYEKQKASVGEISGECMVELLDYAYDNIDAFKLILCCSKGTKYECLIDNMVDIEVKATHNYIYVLRQMGKNVPDIDPVLEHILITGMFNAFFEMIIHDMPRDQAQEYLKEMRAFYTAGWFKIMGLEQP